MSFIATDYINHTAVQQFTVVSSAAAEARPHLSFMAWLKEYRTFSIGLPRQVGKTTALLAVSNESTAIIFPTPLMLAYVKRSRLSVSVGLYDPGSFVEYASSYHTSSNSPKLTQIFMDEFDYIPTHQAEQVMNAIEMLQHRGGLADDVFILKVGTPPFC
jgi:hypothetical protein